MFFLTSVPPGFAAVIALAALALIITIVVAFVYAVVARRRRRRRPLFPSAGDNGIQELLARGAEDSFSAASQHR